MTSNHVHPLNTTKKISKKVRVFLYSVQESKSRKALTPSCTAIVIIEISTFTTTGTNFYDYYIYSISSCGHHVAGGSKSRLKSLPPAANGAHSNGTNKALWLSQEDNDQQRPQMTAR